MKTLIIGGTSGLGLSLASRLHRLEPQSVIVTGRTAPEPDEQEDERLDWSQIDFRPFELARGQYLEAAIGQLVDDLPRIDLLIYSAGFRQQSRLTELTADEIRAMWDVGLHAPTYLIRKLLLRQDHLPGLIGITSTSQIRARGYEPVYAGIKADLAHLLHSLSCDERCCIGKTLVIAPAAMATPFWPSSKHVPNQMPTGLVADCILESWQGRFRRRGLVIESNPMRPMPMAGWEQED